MNKKYVNIALVSFFFCTMHASNGINNKQHQQRTPAENLLITKTLDQREKELAQREKKLRSNVQRSENKRCFSIVSGGVYLINLLSSNNQAVNNVTNPVACYLSKLISNNNRPILKNKFIDCFGNILTSLFFGF